MSAAAAIGFLEGLRVPTGPLAGEPLRLAGFQKRFLRGAFGAGISVAVLSVARGSGKSTLIAGLAVAELVGIFGDQPRREVLIAARSRDQAEVLWAYAADFTRMLPEDLQAEITIRVAPKLEIVFQGTHKVRAIAADGRTILGASPTMVIMDERAVWPDGKGDVLESSLLTGALKRGARSFIISTSAATDQHAFSRWLDEDEPTVYRQEHRAPPGSRPDDPKAIRAANPGIKDKIGPRLEDLIAAGRRAMSRGGQALAGHRLLHLNESTSDDSREAVISIDDWLAVEAEDLPERAGPVVVGIDVGGSASMSAAAFFWPECGRLEVRGWFPSRPDLGARGERDGVGNRYLLMQNEGSLRTLGDGTVPVSEWLGEAVAHVAGQTVASVVFDTFKQSEVEDGLRAIDLRAPRVLRRFGPFHGGEDLERFRRMVYDRSLRTGPTMLMRSALSEAVCRRDGNLNPCLDKGRSLGRIDPVSAAVLAVSEGSRMLGRGPVKIARLAWA